MPHDGTLRVIAIFKLAKGIILIVLALGLLRCVHQDLAQTVEHWLEQLRLDPGNKYFAALLEKAGVINPRTLPLLSGVTFAYAAVFLTEGVGLLLQKRWA